MLRLDCPNCRSPFDDDMPVLSDGAFFICPQCEAEITLTMTWTLPPRERQHSQRGGPAAAA